jgi:hypothetical protein
MRLADKRPTSPSLVDGTGTGTSYLNPKYSAMESRFEKSFGLPIGLMAGIRVNGERSNSDAVSSAGARSVYQIIPATRDAALKKWGIDAYGSDEEAAMVSALLLKDGMKQNKNDIASTVRGYIGGNNPKNWGPATQAYVDRVMGGMRPPGAGTLDDPGDGMVPIGAYNTPGQQGMQHGAFNAGGDRPAQHQTATITLRYPDGKPAAPPLALTFSGAPKPQGTY